MTRNRKSKYGRNIDRLNAITNELNPKIQNVRFSEWAGDAQQMLVLGSWIDTTFHYHIDKIDDMTNTQLYYFIKNEYIKRLQECIDGLK